MADVIFIIGAGCSVSSGAPTANNFLDSARDLYLTNRVADRRVDFELVFEAVSHLQRVHSKAQLDLKNIEAVFSALDFSLTLQKLPGFPKESLEHISRAMRWVIVRTLEETIKFPQTNGQLQPHHEYASFVSMISALRKRHPPLSSAIITFNYDVCIDVALDHGNIPFTYGFDHNESSLPLLKLHGSLNWGRTIDNVTKAWSIPEYRRRLQGLTQDFPKNIRFNVSEYMNRDLGGLLKSPLPVIVPPILGKVEEQRSLSQVWQRAAKELAEASYIIVMGYSLPETDQFFKLPFALGTEGSTVIRDMLVYNPDEGVGKRFLDFLGPGTLSRFTFEPRDFRNAVDLTRGRFEV